jgi:ubiquinone/menaquinone biosynthesis C-methylase UbiE
MDSTQRFSDRVDNYVKYRPSYPQELVDFLYTELGFTNESIVADVGSGTGIFTKLLLERNSKVFAVEPNKDMREAAERMLQAAPGYVSVNGTAEATTLEDGSVDFIVSAQAFHWFNCEKAKEEFSRIVRPSGKVVLIWNNRERDQTPFDKAYEELLVQYGKDYTKVRHVNIQQEELASFFQLGTYTKKSFMNGQTVDFDGLKGRLLSSSYIPLPDEEPYEEMLAALRALFDTYQENGTVTIVYVAEIYYGEA